MTVVCLTASLGEGDCALRRLHTQKAFRTIATVPVDISLPPRPVALAFRPGLISIPVLATQTFLLTTNNRGNCILGDVTLIVIGSSPGSRSQRSFFVKLNVAERFSPARVSMRSKQCYAVIFASFLINSIVTLAQRTPPPPSVTTLPMPNPTRPGSIQDSGTYGYWTYISNQDRAGGALLGKVAIDGEMLPWEPILVTVSCKGATVYTTQTDPKGNFAIIPGRVPGALSTLPDRQRQMQAQYEG